MFYFRVDANEHIATGHVMRCLSIAQELKRRGEDCTFITADTESFRLINSWGFDTISLNSRWDKLELEIDKLHQVVKTRNIKRLFVDSYYATDFYLAELNKFTNIIYLDDLGLITNPVHTIINYNNYADTLGYEKRFEKNNVKLLLGSQYVPLREEFQKVEPIFKEEVKNILITTGGGDLYNVAGSIISQLSLDERFDRYKFNIVSGILNKNLESLDNKEEKNSLLNPSKISKNIQIYKNVQKMSELMKNSDIAVSAAGSTTYELCACGVPMILFTFADNQLPGAKGFYSKNAAIYAGDIRDGNKEVINSILDNILYLTKDISKRKSLIANATKIVNKKGVVALVDSITH